MTRSLRLLSSAAAAPPPEAITLESDMVVILAALLCALICVVGMLAVARCTCIRRRAAAAIPAAPRGLKKKVVQSLPKFVYAKDGAGSVSTECAICLAEFADGDEIRVLPVCRHHFHVGCVDTWLGSHSSCPSCRQTPVVAKCQKCGRIPAGGGAVADEGQVKAGEDVPNLGNPSNAFLP